MRKFILCLAAIVSFNCLSYAQTVTLFDIKDAEIVIMLKTYEDKEFENYFLLQYQGNDFSEVIKSNDYRLLEATKDYVKIRNEANIITFTIDTEYQNENEKIYYGYGLSNRTGKFQLTEGEIQSIIK